MTYNEFILLDYITFTHKVSSADLTESGLSGYLDYYHRITMSQSEIDEALSALAAQNCICFMNGRYQPAPQILELKRRSRRFFADWFSGRDGTRARFRENILSQFGNLT